MRNHRLIAAAAAACLLVALGFASPGPQKKSYVFRGKVEGVNESNKTVSVANEKIEGWMEAMTMAYSVDDPAILKKLKVGDQIKATVYDGDYTLHKIEVVPPGGGEKSKK